MSEEFCSVSLEFPWPAGPHCKNDTYGAGDLAEVSFGFYGGSPPIPAVGEKVVFRDPTTPEGKPDVWLQGYVKEREYSFSTGSYQQRSEASAVLHLERIGVWVH